jgi:hypothetical protein
VSIAAYGNFQTLADLVDYWKIGANGLLWRGDEEMGIDGVRQAGTNGKRDNLDHIRMGASDAGG